MKAVTGKSRPASFRLTQEAHDRLYQNARRAGVSTREWLEKAILDNRTHIVAKQQSHPELRPLLFQVNRAVNHLNQIADRIDQLKSENKVSRDDFLAALDHLANIQASLREALHHAR